MSKPLRLLALCGGQSAEHEISIISANNILSALDPQKYILSIVYITRHGKWYWIDDVAAFLDKGPAQLISDNRVEPVTVAMGNKNTPIISLNNPNKRFGVDCVFPILHGPMGEDGAMQGLLELLNVPYVGAGVSGSAICMEKDITKRLIQFAGLPTCDWICFAEADINDATYDTVRERLGDVVFVKPVNLGSSVGISKVDNQADFDSAISKAFRFDQKIIVEAYVPGREIEVSVLGNDDPVASLPGELIIQHDFYSYDAKYVDPNGAQPQTPADLPENLVQTFQQYAAQAYKTLHCQGMARVDFFLTKGGDIFINEVNTIPGFTDISMYPKNWDVSGLSYAQLLDDLIQLALGRYERTQRLSKEREVDPSSDSLSSSVDKQQ